MENFIKHIDAYLSGELSGEVLNRFERELTTNDTLIEQVNIHQLERETALLFLQKEMKTNIQQWRKEGLQDNKKEAKVVHLGGKKEEKIAPLRRFLSIAASVLVLITAGSIFWANQQFDNISLAKSYYLQADAPGNRSGTPVNNENFEAGLNAFLKEKNYTKAQIAFSKIQKDDPHYIESKYYLGHASVQLKNYDKAIIFYDDVLASKDLPTYLNRQKIQWNLLLAKVGADQLDAPFHQQLDELIQSNQMPFSQKAKELKTQLNSPWRKIVF